MKKILMLVGARPNFIKIAPIYKILKKSPERYRPVICHTGQHFSATMSDIFFNEFNLPVPDHHLGISGGSSNDQTARIMQAFGPVLQKEKPDLLLVPGDVNSTMAGALVASKMGIPVGHIESGLRSFDRTMPEEINRIVTDLLSDLLFVSEHSGLINLRNEGQDPNKLFFVGNVMIDSLIQFLPQIRKSKITKILNVDPGKFVLVTFHRPSNVDVPQKLRSIVNIINQISEDRTVVFPVHPRTEKSLAKHQLHDTISDAVVRTKPIGYFDFLALMKNAELVVTDSGGIQEETTFLGVPCLTLRENTERPVTVEVGTNQLISDISGNQWRDAAKNVFSGQGKKGQCPELWDGNTARRIVDVIYKAI
jgi:UDP-N-acetylglucosamine 2-epimerase (non-hydrolysing)